MPTKRAVTQFTSAIPVEFIGNKYALERIYAMVSDGEYGRDFEAAFLNGDATPV